MGPIEAWLAEIAAATKQPVTEVQRVLAEHAVRPQTALPRPHLLRVTSVDFDGLRPEPGGAGQPGGTPAPFHFRWQLEQGVWCLASAGTNEAGKSSVLEIVLWCLRGRDSLQRDVRSWLRHVRTEFDLDGEALCVEMTVAAGIPTGTVTSLKTAAVLVDFAGVKAFEESMDAFMMDRLALEPLRTQQKSPSGPEGPPVTGELSWPAYASGLHINRAGLKCLLGNELQNALPTRLLELFLGAPWAPTMVAASVARKIVAAQLLSATRRAEEDAKARERQLGELTARLEAATKRRDGLAAPRQAASDLTRAYEQVSAATRRASKAEQDEAAARSVYDALEAQRQELASTLQTQREADLAKAFFHTLTPTVCPRCDSKVTSDRWAREARDQECSLCSSPVAVHDGDEEEGNDEGREDLLQSLADVQKATEIAAEARAEHQNRVALARADLASAQAALQSALSAPGLATRQEAELEVARLEGAVEERKGRFSALGAAVDIAPLQRAEAILKAAEAASHKRRTDALKEVLTEVENDIVTMGRSLGLSMLERVKLGTNATLTVYKGGQPHPYGSVTEGEQLRLKIVTAIALLHHGIRSGIGRHPGLLIIDSPGAEEVDSGNLQLMLRDLVTLTDTAPDLQVIIATARGEEVASIIPEGHLRMASAGQRLW
jgi:hypothetical protein